MKGQHFTGHRKEPRSILPTPTPASLNIISQATSTGTWFVP